VPDLQPGGMMRFLETIDEIILAYVAACCEWAWDWFSISRKQMAYGFNVFWLLLALLEDMNRAVWFGVVITDLFVAFGWALIIHLDLPVWMLVRILNLEVFLVAIGMDIALGATPQRCLTTFQLLAAACVTYLCHPQQPPKGPRGGKRKEALDKLSDPLLLPRPALIRE
jgi:hypothetical protein